MNIRSFIHPSRTFLPCSGVGRHINNVVLKLSKMPDADLELSFAAQWLEYDQKLPANAPLRDFPFQSLNVNERILERSWKTLGMPHMDYWFKGTDVVYCPMETFIPLKKIPLVVTIHDIQAFETDLPWSDSAEHKMFRKKWSVWTTKVFKQAARIFTVSEYSRQRMIEVFNADPKQIVVVGNGIEETYFSQGSEVNSKFYCRDNQPYILVVGGLRYKKGADAILKVAKALQEQKSPIQILVAGEQEEHYNQIANTMSNVQILGMVDDEELPNLYRGASALLFLSYYEGFGIPALEAMAVGIPAIVSNRGSLPEIVGEAGLVVDPDDTEAVLFAIHRVREDQEFRESIIVKGRLHAQAYTWEVCAKRVYQALKEVAIASKSTSFCK